MLWPKILSAPSAKNRKFRSPKFKYFQGKKKLSESKRYKYIAKTIQMFNLRCFLFFIFFNKNAKLHNHPLSLGQLQIDPLRF